MRPCMGGEVQSAWHSMLAGAITPSSQIGYAASSKLEYLRCKLAHMCCRELAEGPRRYPRKFGRGHSVCPEATTLGGHMASYIPQNELSILAIQISRFAVAVLALKRAALAVRRAVAGLEIHRVGDGRGGAPPLAHEGCWLEASVAALQAGEAL
eukprot:CAMPEP_0115178446 /NCGR_PEP_ID=MMETSP0270-20121206/5904_1 /TAXON_ID=71861 /ORGANISM="Scrippsiella trochoidea, Strain CCMP3099" /LENGTH=153 /DNA_ID=CAMNT_0002591407 /DNA_START=548 /DNA_END=1011 /DNA_ORIENTATION=-